ncbi:nitroreductase family protein [Helicovermis profundi]|uniref:Nitroreductase family protein n=1 Tax=Helicovermis profundi TaxID=3065157 RepID=A0AAU9EEZ9_9FIRM|nr:nitroreductase family protein [Clostridia bacterium S502]
MKFLKILEKRKSIREYKSKKLSDSHFDLIDSLSNNLPNAVKNQGLEVNIFKDGSIISEKLDGIIGYHGIMIKAPHYLLIFGDENEVAYKMTGYLGEWLVLKLTKEDIGTCWIDVGANDRLIKEKLNLVSHKSVLGIIALGYPKSDARVSSIYAENDDKLISENRKGYPNTDIEYKDNIVSRRKPIEDIVFLSKWGNKITAEELDTRNYDEVFYYMRLAPSWTNRQPWKFILDGTKIILYIESSEQENNNYELIESGIAMLYFEVAMHGQGIPGYWNLEKLEDEKKYGAPDNYYYIGYYTF